MGMGGYRNFLSFREKYYNYTDFSDYSGIFLTIKSLKWYNSMNIALHWKHFYCKIATY